MTTVRRGIRSIALALPILVLAGCQPAEEPEAEGAETESAGTVAALQPDTTGQAIHDYLQEQNYRESWTHWPEREPFYEGTEPHGMLLSTYMNETAAEGLASMREGGRDDLPFGSIIVKENYMPDSTLAAVTVMYKQELYDPENHDWFWVKHNADGSFDAQGRAESCIACHSEASGEWDYLQTARIQFGG